MDKIERERRFKVLIKELHPTKNKKLDVNNLKSGSAKRLWWKCNKGHIWDAILSNRVYNSSGCPKCKKGKVFKLPLIIDEKPELLDELHPERNNNIDFHKLTGGSEKRIWWLCKKGHEWNTSAAQRYKSSTGCPYCALAASSLPRDFEQDKISYQIIERVFCCIIEPIVFDTTELVIDTCTNSLCIIELTKNIVRF